MVKSSLKRKLLRDFRGSMVQFLSILIMLMLGVAVFIGLDSTWRSLEEFTTQLSDESNLADIQIFANSVTAGDMQLAEQMDGVQQVERRLSLQVHLADEPSAKLELNGLESSGISQFTVREGTDALQAGEALLDQRFAEANGIAVGDEITLGGNQQEVSYRVAGLATSAAYIYSTSDATAVIPDHKQYGFVAVRSQDAEMFTGQPGFYNEMLITTAEHADVEQLKNELSGLMEAKLIGSVTRPETRNDLSVKQKIAQYQSIGNLFPFVFFAVVILMTFTTMIRLMNNQRQQIGLLKAIGYTRRQITLHYLSYGIWISLCGSLLGIIIGWKLIPARVWNFFEELFVLPDAEIVLYWPKVAAIILIAVCSTVLATLYVCLRTESEQPSALMRTKAARSGSSIAMERIKPLWNRFTASQRLIARQIFRNKIRLFMTVIGVMGCTALLLTALGMRDTIKNVAVSVYEKTYLYEAKFYLEDGVSPESVEAILAKEKAEPVLEAQRVLSSENKTKMGTVHVLKEQAQLIQFYDAAGKRVKLKTEGALITQKTADMYELAVGDEIKVRIAPNHYVGFRVNEIAKVNIGQGIYVSEQAWEKQGLVFTPTALLSEDADVAIPEDMVSRVVRTSGQEEDFMTSMNSTLSLSVMMIAAAAVLAFIVLYNLGILNFTERERDLATLQVLGFHPKELRSFVIFENMIFSVAGILIGIPAGFALHRMIFAKAGMGDELDFSAVIHSGSVAISILFTLVIAVAVNVIVLKKVKEIRMVEALKSVE